MFAPVALTSHTQKKHRINLALSANSIQGILNSLSEEFIAVVAFMLSPSRCSCGISALQFTWLTCQSVVTFFFFFLTLVFSVYSSHFIFYSFVPFALAKQQIQTDPLALCYIKLPVYK